MEHREFSIRRAKYMLRIHFDLTAYDDGVEQAEMYIDMMNDYKHRYADVPDQIRARALEHRAVLAKAIAAGDEPEQIIILRGYLDTFVRAGYLGTEEML